MKTGIACKNVGGRKLKAFSLVELVVVVLIIGVLAVAIFAGGSAAIQKSRVSRTTSDLHNFQVAAEMTLNANPSVANIYDNNMSSGSSMEKAVKEFDEVLAADYKLVSMVPEASVTTGNLRVTADTADTGKYAIFKSKKLDAWDNPYYVIFDASERHEGTSDFSITVASAGPNAQSTIGGEVENDDILMLAESSNNAVSARMFNASDIGTVSTATKSLKVGGNSLENLVPVTYVGDTGFTNESVITSAPSKSLATSTPEEPSEPTTVTYTIVFKNKDGSELQRSEVEEGETPIYTGETPFYDWLWYFNGWDKAITPATKDETYTAQFYYNACFIAGSKVLMGDGSYKNIEDVQVGERVMSYNIETGEFYETEVIDTAVKYITVPYCEITLENGMTIHPTKNHPILTDEGFKTVEKTGFDLLMVGDNVVTIDGTSRVVSITEVVFTEDMIAVYDINVKDDEEDADTDVDTNDNFVVEGVVTHNHSG